LLFGRSGGRTVGADIEMREIEILVLRLEDYRERFVDFYERRRGAMRPHVLRFVGEMLTDRLPDFPITYPGSWGIPAAVGGLDGQVLNVWAEMLPGLMHMSAAARQNRRPAEPAHPAGADDVWAKDSGYELVQFLGYDNAFYFSLAHLGLIFAHGGVLEPTAIITNEFYHLEGSKFSTSRRHLIWARDMVEKHGADNVRFYLALNNPEHQVANFTEDEFLEAVCDKLQAPLTRIAEALRRHEGHRVGPRGEAAIFDRFRARLLRSFALETFSLRAAADILANLLGLLAALGDRATRTDAPEVWLVVLGLRYVAHYAAPLLPGLAAELRAQLGMPAQSKPGCEAGFEPGSAASDALMAVPRLDLARLFNPAEVS
jgi:methionyl-tRNA synthetase